MRVFVFAGPTLAPDDGKRELDAVFLPPAVQGDVYAAARERPWGIGIIDGYFERVPAVWHKEILWAMSQGVHVFGSASMGALRAAELAMYGMEGIGKVFDAFQSEELEDDDEVTVVHAGPEAGHRPLSDAMVNIRATLAAAVTAEVIGTATHNRLVSLAKAMFFPDRDYESIMHAGQEAGVSAAELDKLRAWLPAGRVDQKRLDAIEMLRTMRRQLESGRPPKQVHYSFQHTDAWEQVRRQVLGRTLANTAGADTFQDDAVLEELRLEGPQYLRMREDALLHCLAVEVDPTPRGQGDDSLLPRALEAFRIRHGLLNAGDVEPWLEREGMDVDSLERLLRDEIKASRAREVFATEVESALVDRLRMHGEYSRLAARARDKQTRLAERGEANPGLEAVGIAEQALWRWYFEEHLGIGETPSVAEYAERLGYPNRMPFLRAVLREWCYVGNGSSPG